MVCFDVVCDFDEVFLCHGQFWYGYGCFGAFCG
jgi:hypothetical protein